MNGRTFGRATTVAVRNNDTDAYVVRIGKCRWLLPIDVAVGNSMRSPYASQ